MVDDTAAFNRLIAALEAWLDKVVIVGGWAHRLHRLHPLTTQTLSYSPLATRDADVAFAADQRLVGNIGAALQAAQFNEEFSGEDTPPVAQYRLASEDDAAIATADMYHDAVMRVAFGREKVEDVIASMTTPGTTGA